MKKLLCVVLSVIMLIPSFVVADASNNTPIYTDEIFNGEPMYLIEDRFTAASRAIPDANARPSGWDIDYRGGNISSDYIGVFTLSDISKTESITMSKKVMKHEKEKITFETGFTPHDVKSGFTVELLGDGNDVAKFKTEDNEVVFVKPDGDSVVLGSYGALEDFSIKAVMDFDTKSVELYANGIYKATVGFTSTNAMCLDEVRIKTPKENTLDVSLGYIYLYINYIVNETFVGNPIDSIPSDWELLQTTRDSSAIKEMKSSDYPDYKSMNLLDENTTDSFAFLKKFEGAGAKVVVEWQVLTQTMNGTANFSLMSEATKALSITFDNQDIKFTDNQKYTYQKGLWYKIKVVADTDTNTADIYLNQKLKAENIRFQNDVSIINGIQIESEADSICDLWLDDIVVYNQWELPDDYVPTPEKVDSEYLIGMQMCSLWREGTHFGWDRVSSFDEKRPYLGYYTEGSPEVADWEIKWMLESGVDYQIYCWYRGLSSVHNSPIKDSHLSPALNEGFLNAKYSNMMDFAIMWENSAGCGGMEDFTENIVPYWIEYYFKDNRYLVIDNKPVVGIFNPSEFIKSFGNLESAQKAIAYLRQACKDAGFDDAIILGQINGGTQELFTTIKQLGVDYIYAYSWTVNSYPADSQIMAINADWEKCEVGYIPTVSMGFDRGAWESGYKGGYLTPLEMGQVFDYIKNENVSLEASGQEVERMLMLGCWNEFGEGHFFMPSEKQGFGYLNAVREKFTDAGTKSDFQRPTEKGLARLEALYSQNRRALKLLTEARYSMDFSEMNSMQKWDLSSWTDYLKWKANTHITNFYPRNGAACGTATGIDPIITGPQISLDLSQVKAVKINASFENASSAQLYFTTQNSTDWDENKGVTFPTEPGGEYNEYIVDLEKTTFYRQGNLEGDFLTAIRFDPGRVEGDFAIKSIEIIGFEHIPTKIYIDNNLYTPVSEPVLVDGTWYLEGQRLLYTMGGYPLWDYESKKFTIEYKDKKLVMTADSNIALLNGNQVELSNAPYYSNGKFMMPLQDVCELLTVGFGWDNENSIMLTTNITNNVGIIDETVKKMSNNLMKISSFEGVTGSNHGYGLNLHNTVATDSNYWDVNGSGDSSANTTGIVNDEYHTGSASLRVDENNASWTKTDTYSGRPRIKVMNINEVSNIGGLMSADKQATVSVWLKAVDNVSSWTMCIGTDAHHNADPMDFRLKRLYEAEADGTNWVNLTAEIDFSQFDYSMFPDSGVCTGGTGSYDSTTKESVLDARWTIQIWANRTDESSNASYYVDDFDIYYADGIQQKPYNLISNIQVSQYGTEADGVYKFNDVPANTKFLTINTSEVLKAGEKYELDFDFQVQQEINGTPKLKLASANENSNISKETHNNDQATWESFSVDKNFSFNADTSTIYLLHDTAMESIILKNISLTPVTDNEYMPTLSKNLIKLQFGSVVRDFSMAEVKLDGQLITGLSIVNPKVLAISLPANITEGKHTLSISNVMVGHGDSTAATISTVSFYYKKSQIESAIYSPTNYLVPLTSFSEEDMLASIKIVNYDETGTNFAGTIIFAGYNGGVLKKIVSKEFNIAVGGKEWRRCDVSAKMDGCDTAKLFVWDSLNGLRPISASIELK